MLAREFSQSLGAACLVAALLLPLLAAPAAGAAPVGFGTLAFL